MKKKLIIFGNTKYAEMVCDYFTEFSQYEVVAFTVDAAYINGDIFYGKPLIDFANIEKLLPPSEYDMFIAVGSTKLNHVRARICAAAREKGYKLPTFIHPDAYVSPKVTIGENCILMECCHVMRNCKIGNNVIIWPHGWISHDNIIHDNAYIAGLTNGFCEIGKNCFLGAGAIIANHVSIANDNLIAMAAAVRRSTEENSIYEGNPATKRPGITALEFVETKNL